MKEELLNMESDEEEKEEVLRIEDERDNIVLETGAAWFK